jgi:hypothetical protein
MTKIKSSVFDPKNPLWKPKNYLNVAKVGSEGELLQLFATPMYVVKADISSSSFHVPIKETLAGIHQERPGALKRNWLKRDFFGWDVPGIPEFKSFIDQHLKHIFASQYGEFILSSFQYEAEAWANIKTGHDWHSVHIHAGSLFSFVYYVACEGGDIGYKSLNGEDYNGGFFGGMIQFQDPRGASPYMVREKVTLAAAESRFFVEPSEGLLVIFPSYLAHLVAPVHSDFPRITIAGNFWDFQTQPIKKPRPGKS